MDREGGMVWGMPLLIGEAVAHLSQARWGLAKGCRSVKLLSCTHDISITQPALIAPLYGQISQYPECHTEHAHTHTLTEARALQGLFEC